METVMTGLGVVEVAVLAVGALLTLLALVYMRDKATQDRFHSIEHNWQDRMNDLQTAWQNRMDDLRGWCSAELTQLSNTCLRRDEIKDHITPIYNRIDQTRDDIRDMRNIFQEYLSKASKK